MSTGNPLRIDPDRLRFQLARRGRCLGDLTKGPHSVSWATIGRLTRGIPIRRNSALRIALRLKGWPIVVELDQILEAPAEGRGSVPVLKEGMELPPQRVHQEASA